MTIVSKIAGIHQEMTKLRRDLHANPELGLQETRTSDLVQTKLRSFGVDEIITGLARTGVVGVIHGRDECRRAIGLRADMDALPIHEATGLPYSSQNVGVMHACGHDGHTAMLLGAARYLAETRNFNGTVYTIFQPAEEGLGGGAVMVKEGLFECCPMELVFSMHNWPQLRAGTFAWRSGPIMAGAATVDITIIGKGSHGAFPHLGIDPIVIASHVVCSMQTIVARTIDPLDSAVVTIGSINSDGAVNVIPDTVRMLGTARWYDPRIGDQIEGGIRRLASGIAESFGAKAHVSFEHVCPPTINDADATALSRRAAAAVVGKTHVASMPHPTMSGEDFAFMLNAKRGSYILLGSGRSQTDPTPHQSNYDFNDEILPIGASYWATLAEQILTVEAT